MFFGFGLVTGLLLQAVWLGQFVVKLWAMIDAARRREDAYPAVDRLTKGVWLVILGVTLLTGFFFGPLNFFSVIGDVAAGVYLVDVRPRLKAITGR